MATYASAGGFSGTDTVSYTVTDGLLSDTGLLTINVTNTNQPPVAPVSYDDNVGALKNIASTAASTDDAMPGINIGTGLSVTPRLYIDGTVVASTYNAETGTLTPVSPVANGNHTFTYTLTNAAGVESPQSDGLTIQTTAKIYYVSPTGSNSNSGTLLESPLLTIDAALSKAATGDTIYLMTGVYEEYVSVYKDGITLAAYQNNHPVIDGQNLAPRDWSSLISISGNDNLVYGIEVRNANMNGASEGGYGINVSGKHNIVSNMNVHHIWENGIIVQGDYNTVEYSTIWQASSANMGGTASGGWAQGLGAGRGNRTNPNVDSEVPGITSYATFRYNEVYNNWGEGLSLFETTNSILEGNVVYDNWTVNLYLSDSTNSIVKGNLVYASDNPAIPVRNNNRVGIALADEVDAAPRSQNNIVVDNMIYNASFGAFTFTEISSNASGLKNVLIANNTVVNGNFSVGNAVNFTHTNSTIVNNIFSGTNNYIPTNTGISFSNNNWGNIPALGQSATDVVGNPLLAKTGSVSPGELTADYFRLLAGSPVIDKGAILASVSDDFLGTLRGSAPDLGAYEYKVSPNANATIAAGDVNLSAMFEGDGLYNQDIGDWNVSAVVDMSRMFRDAKSFNQDISNWDVSSLVTADQMLDNSGMSDQNYDLLLAGWADVNTSSGETGLQSGVSFGAKGVQYTNATDKQYLIDQYGWTFTDGGLAMDVTVGSNQSGDVINLSSATTGQTVHSLGGNDTITGSAYADLIVGGAGNDTLTGGAGRDTFSYRHTNEGTDVITDFVNGASGDILDIHHLLDGATPLTIGTFVGLSNNNGKLQLNIDADGNASGTDVSILLQNISYTTATSDPLFLQNMIANGNLVI